MKLREHANFLVVSTFEQDLYEIAPRSHKIFTPNYSNYHENEAIKLMGNISVLITPGNQRNLRTITLATPPAVT
jgi:hypothetical protein